MTPCVFLCCTSNLPAYTCHYLTKFSKTSYQNSSRILSEVENASQLKYEFQISSSLKANNSLLISLIAVILWPQPLTVTVSMLNGWPHFKNYWLNLKNPAFLTFLHLPLHPSSPSPLLLWRSVPSPSTQRTLCSASHFLLSSKDLNFQWFFSLSSSSTVHLFLQGHF